MSQAFRSLADQWLGKISSIERKLHDLESAYVRSRVLAFHRRTSGANVSIPNTGADTLVNDWATVVTDVGGITHSAGVFTVPSAGMYVVHVTVTWSAAVTIPKIRLYHSGTILFIEEPAVTTTGANLRQYVGGVLYCVDGDTIDVRMAHTSAGAINVSTRYIAIGKVG